MPPVRPLRLAAGYAELERDRLNHRNTRAIKGAHAETDETRELAKDAGASETEPQIGVSEDEAIVVGRFGARSRVKQGDEVSAVVDTRALHFFDPETGMGIYDLPKGAQS